MRNMLHFALFTIKGDTPTNNTSNRMIDTRHIPTVFLQTADFSLEIEKLARDEN